MSTLLSNFFRWPVLLAFACVSAACASGPRLIAHSFEFDARRDSPDVEILDYRYGDSKQPGARNPVYLLNEGKALQATGIYGTMLVGDTLYAKWRIKSTGEIYHDTVDLRHRLPVDIREHTIHFAIKNDQLFVYLISPGKLDPNPCPSRDELGRLSKSDALDDRIFSMYCYRKITVIYPVRQKR
jgi:hypothetical protein